LIPESWRVLWRRSVGRSLPLPDGTLKFSIKIDSTGGILQTLRDLLEELAAREEVVPGV